MERVQPSCRTLDSMQTFFQGSWERIFQKDLRPRFEMREAFEPFRACRLLVCKGKFCVLLSGSCLHRLPIHDSTVYTASFLSPAPSASSGNSLGRTPPTAKVYPRDVCTLTSRRPASRVLSQPYRMFLNYALTLFPDEQPLEWHSVLTSFDARLIALYTHPIKDAELNNCAR
eukprot:923579-Prorocentrum_minimum.AAC.3